MTISVWIEVAPKECPFRESRADIPLIDMSGNQVEPDPSVDIKECFICDHAKAINKEYVNCDLSEKPLKILTG